MPTNLISAKKFWKTKASNYPLPFDPDTFKKTKRIIRRIKKENIIFKNKNIIDIGCGTGIYTLPFALEAAEVTGTDFSLLMLKKMKEEAKNQKIKNLKTIYSSWEDFDFKKHRKNYDIAFASMTAAIKTASAVKKMETVATDYCIVVSWAGKRKNAFMREIYKNFGIKDKAPDFIGTISKILKKRDVKYKKVLIEDSWSFKGTAKEAAIQALPHLQINGVKISLDKLEKIIAEKFGTREIHHTTFAGKGIVIWKPPLINFKNQITNPK
ncbi:MAG: class I SAM-dependent methyltransferase [Elusimicrobiota bacterium]|nr:class I SAM-dependent methyltransferase [Elusimicrobiota bacterium]